MAPFPWKWPFPPDAPLGIKKTGVLIYNIICILESQAVTVGRVRPCTLLDLRMVSVVHNTLRGAASGSILNAELLVAEGFVKS